LSPSVEICFAPTLFPYRLTQGDCIIVISDILRASTSVCAALDNGVKEIIPVADVEAAREMKKKGYIVASERDGSKLDFADFGNSPFSFLQPELKGKTIVYCTTNGTQAIDTARGHGTIVIGSFLNLFALAQWIAGKEENVVILCSGWKGKFSLEDSVFAGALAQKLLDNYDFIAEDDSAKAALDLWQSAQPDLLRYIEKASHRYRLKKLGLDDILEYTFTLDSTNVIPVLEGDRITNAAPGN
jgi:2-phosphosulfolactate phosphatase